ncbi:cellular morphogenesis regulator dopa [Clathrospora elynae]|uniref:Cellular morphogenesis regulator dopa n=1 Tax=Clathrospora elynae TaxID=706981 RepID=A0A6A5T3E2_9PLEO|nr:cellular morphogenesis regulator dopa [Clathrospora elynae]
MSADLTANLQLFSPPGSGRSSPAPRTTRNAPEEPPYKKDKGFRRYAASVERALALWDTAQQEWADYISFLGRLLKALQAHPSSIPVIPHSDTVALRLAQCLNPTLPSGVHQKALEVYDYIFSTIGKDALARDLHLYFPGVASVLSFASLSVRPLFLSVFERHILKLDAVALRPALKAIILSLLPGLEDETSEDFERMALAAEKLRNAVQDSSGRVADAKTNSGSSHFWQCLFLATITNASRRQGALAFLVRRLPKFGPSRRQSSLLHAATLSEDLPAEAEVAISPEPGLLIRCFESGLSDPQLLIQRGFLDLLVSHLPLDSPVLQQRIGKGDLERLVAAAAGVVSRRDMSLNRRLWAWFLGPEPTASDSTDAVTSPTSDRHNAAADPSAHQAAFFSRYGLEALTNSVLKMINRRSTSPSERARPFRVCLSLMDRWEVGGLIVPEIFLPALQSVHSYSETASKEQVDEVMRSASAFFDGVDSGLIWGKLIQLVTSSLQTDMTHRDEALRNIKLAKYVLARFNLKEEDMLLHHMPLMVLSTLASLNEAFEKTGKPSVDTEVVSLALEIADSLVQILPDRALQNGQTTEQELSASLKTPRAATFQRVRTFYEESQGSFDAADAPFSPSQLGQIVLREASRMFTTSLQSGRSNTTPEMPSRILANLIFKTQRPTAIDDLDTVTVFRNALQTSDDTTTNLSFTHLSATTAVLLALQTARPSEPYIASAQLSELMYPLVRHLWQYLSPTLPKYHVETARCILQLHTIAPASRTVESAVSSVILRQIHQSPASTSPSDCGRRFATLWTHIMHELSLQSEKRAGIIRRPSNGVPAGSTPTADFHSVLTRPLLLLLDTLAEEDSETSVFMRSWLQELPSLNRVFEVLAVHIQSLNCLTASNNLAPEKSTSKHQPPSNRDDTKECLYYLKHIFNVLKRPSHFTWLTLAEVTVAWPEQDPSRISIQEWLIRTCLVTLSLQVGASEMGAEPHIQELHRLSVSIILQIYQSPFASPLRELELEVPLMTRLRSASPSLQSILLGAELAALRLRLTRPLQEPVLEQKTSSHLAQRSRLSLAINRNSEDHEPAPIPPPPQLIECLKYGFSSPGSRLVLDDWIQFLVEVLPMFADTIFQNLLPLVDCLCKQINITFEHLKSTFTKDQSQPSISPESTLISLMNGLEQILAKAHERLTTQETKVSASKNPEQPQGFFSNVVSGVFSSETSQTRTPTANSRLTVLLCFQDTVRICFAIWSWAGYGQGQELQDPASALSFAYTSLRMRNRARRTLEHLFGAEALECLETLVVLWAHATPNDVQGTAITGLLNVLNGSKPKHTIPAIFNAIYSRTDPGALDANRLSTLTSDLTDTDLVAFLVEYTYSLEDDAMDEIWQDCTLFLRDVLANPLPHRQILPTLLEFTAVIGQKVDNTNFGEQRKMRRELADIFARILTAIFTTRSMGYLQDTNQVADEKAPTTTNGNRAQKRAVDVVSVLISIVPKLSVILVENDRVAKVVSDISTSVIGPTFRAKAFPDNVSRSILDLLQGLTKIAQGNKFLKKDISDAFNDPKFFNTPLPLLREAWLPILAQWTQSDKERVPELLSRLSAPTTAGIMFGVGATSARQEADRKTQLTLRRIALLILGSPEDAFTPNIPQILERIVELLTATPASSPSSITRADTIVLLRSVILKTSPVHLASLWPVVNGELTSALSSLLPDAANKEHYNNAGIIQTCKLLDELVVLDPDDFQLMEWLFISDTIDAVYKPITPPTILSLTDEINDVLSQSSATVSTATPLAASGSEGGEPKRTLFLDPLIQALEKEEHAAVLDMTRGELVNRLVRPFLGNLAMNAFEARYGGGEADWWGVWASVVGDAGS